MSVLLLLVVVVVVAVVVAGEVRRGGVAVAAELAGVAAAAARIRCSLFLKRANEGSSDASSAVSGKNGERRISSAVAYSGTELNDGDCGHAVETPPWARSSSPGGRLPRRRIPRKLDRSFFIFLLGRRERMLLPPLLNFLFASAFCNCFSAFFCFFCCLRVACFSHFGEDAGNVRVIVAGPAAALSWDGFVHPKLPKLESGRGAVGGAGSARAAGSYVCV